MGHDLQIQRANIGACPAWTSGVGDDVLATAGKRVVNVLANRKERLAGRKLLLRRIGQHRIPVHLPEMKRFTDLLDQGTQQRTQDRIGVVLLGGSQIRRVAGNISNQQIAGVGSHG
jgi:hypothetical protein